ncbi:hypothetical protein COBT_004112, partial [Conglomerata obtusa]
TEKDITCFKKKLYYESSIYAFNFNVKKYEFTPHKNALDLYKQSYQADNENKKIETNYGLILYIDNDAINSTNTANNVMNHKLQTGAGAINTKARNSLDTNGQNNAPTDADNTNNKALKKKPQDLIIIGIVGISVVVVIAIVIAILVKK